MAKSSCPNPRNFAKNVHILPPSGRNLALKHFFTQRCAHSVIFFGKWSAAFIGLAPAMQTPVGRWRIPRRQTSAEPAPDPSPMPATVPSTLGPHQSPVRGRNAECAFADKEQIIVNSLQNEITPRIKKEIGKAFNKVRSARGTNLTKAMNRVKLIEIVKELEDRRAVHEVEQQLELQFARQQHAHECQLHEHEAQVEEAKSMLSGSRCAAKRRRYLPDLMVAYTLHRDNMGKSYMEPIAAYKMY